jgi:hypothetical protein
MKLRILVITALSSLLLLATGCSTTSHFKIPAKSTLTVYDRQVQPRDVDGAVKTRPFFWSSAGGVPYSVQDESGKTIRQGKLKSHFRVASIFWPPFAIIYWPMGFGSATYDLTREADGVLVRDIPSPLATTPATAKK